MLLFTTFWTGVVFSIPALKFWVFTNLWLFYICLVLTIAMMCAMICCYRTFNKYPRNYGILVAYTVTHAYLIGAVCAQYEPEAVISAAVCTLVMFIGLTALACFMK